MCVGSLVHWRTQLTSDRRRTHQAVASVDRERVHSTGPVSFELDQRSSNRNPLASHLRAFGLAVACSVPVAPRTPEAQDAATAAGAAVTDSPRPTEAATVPELRARLEFPTANNGESKPTALLSCDIDGDGRDELIAVTRGPGSVQVWRGLDAKLAPHPQPLALPIGDYALGPVFLGGTPPNPSRPPTIVVAPRAAPAEIDVIDVRRLATAENDRSSAIVRRIPLDRRPRALASGDLGNDGTPDIAVVTIDDELRVFGASDSPSRASFVDEKRGAPLATALHVTHDGKGIVVAFQNTQRVELWSANRTADGFTFRSEVAAELAGFPRDMEELDVDVDGDNELVVVGGDDSVWMFGMGTQGGIDAALRATPTRFSTGAIPVDVAQRSHEAGGSELLVTSLLGLTSSRYRAAPEGFHALDAVYAGQSPHAGGYGDFDGDGKSDVAIANADAGRVSVLFGDEREEPIQAHFVATDRTPHSLATGDLDGDGYPELLVLNAVDGTLSVAKNERGVLGDSQRQVLAKRAYAIRAADLDGDGHLEGTFVVERDTDAAITVTFGEGGKLFERAAFPPVVIGKKARDLLLRDFDGDGRVDLLAADPARDRIVFVRNTTERPGELALAAPVDFEAPSGPVALASLSAPSEVAIALGGPGPRIGVSVMRLETTPEGAARWVEISSIDTGLFPLRIASSDLDGDGQLDLAVLVTEEVVDSQCYVLPCLRQNDGNWRKLEPFRVGFRPFAIASGDLDGDGRGEIVVSAQNSHHVELWLTKPGSPLSFERTADLGAHGGCLDVLLSDLDRDGRPEILVADGFSLDVGVIAIR